MYIIRLTNTQRLGLAKHGVEIQRASADANAYIRLCLEENGGDLGQPWRWNESKMQWELNDDGGPKPE